MHIFATTQLGPSEALLVSRELALAADRSLSADNRDKCVTIISRLYDLFDDLKQGLEQDVSCPIVAADTAAWVSHMASCAELLVLA